MKSKLYRIRKEKKIGGVAAGLSEYFDVDVVFIRLFFVLATFFGGAGLISYMVLWIIVPEKEVVFPPNAAQDKEPIDDEELKNPNEEEIVDEKKNRGNIAGIVLIIIGVFFLADNFWSFIHFHHIFPLILIAIGTALLLNSKN